MPQEVCRSVPGHVCSTRNRMCLAGIMAAEHEELPPEVRAEVVEYAEMNVRWAGPGALTWPEDAPGPGGNAAPGAGDVRRVPRSPTRGAGDVGTWPSTTRSSRRTKQRGCSLDSPVRSVARLVVGFEPLERGSRSWIETELAHGACEVIPLFRVGVDAGLLHGI